VTLFTASSSHMSHPGGGEQGAQLEKVFAYHPPPYPPPQGGRGWFRL